MTILSAASCHLPLWAWISLRRTILNLQVAVNHANANKSIEMTPQELGTAYVAATATSVLIAVGLTRMVPRLRIAPSTKQILSRLVPFVSVASAGVVNISCIRWKEMRDGVDVFQIEKDADGNEEKVPLGKSSKAGQMAVMQSAASRVFTNMYVALPFLLTVGLHSSSHR